MRCTAGEKSVEALRHTSQEAFHLQSALCFDVLEHVPSLGVFHGDS